MDPTAGATGSGPISCGTVRENDMERGLKPGVSDAWRSDVGWEKGTAIGQKGRDRGWILRTFTRGVVRVRVCVEQTVEQVGEGAKTAITEPMSQKGCKKPWDSTPDLPLVATISSLFSASRGAETPAWRA